MHPFACAVTFNNRNSRDHTLIHELGEYFEKNPDAQGGTVAPSVKLYRYRTCEAFMYAGIAPAKIDKLRNLLQRCPPHAAALRHIH